MSLFASKIFIVIWVATLVGGTILSIIGNINENSDMIFRAGVLFGISGGSMIGMLLFKYEVRKILKTKYGITDLDRREEN